MTSDHVLSKRLASLVLVLVAAACGGGGGDKPTPTGPAPVTVASVVVTPGNASLLVGDIVPLTAAARDAQGSTISGKTFTWSSDAPAVATVSSDGHVSAVAAGTATVRATVDGISGTSSIGVAALAQGVTQSVGAQGGALQVPLANGVGAQLVVPAGALAADVTLGIQPTRPPSGALASFTVSPAGTAFTKPVTISLTLPSPPPSGRAMALTFQSGRGTRFVPLTVGAGGLVVTGTLSALGDVVAGSSRLRAGPSRAAASTSGSTLELILAAMAVTEIEDSAQAAITLMSQQAGDFTTATHLNEVMTVLAAVAGQPTFTPRGPQLLGGWGPSLCPNVDVAMTRLKGLPVAAPFDYPDFTTEVRTASGWQGLAAVLDSLGVQPRCVDHYGEAIDSISSHFTKRVISDMLSTQGRNLLVRFSDFIDQFIPQAVSLVANLGILGQDQNATDLKTATGVVLDTLRSVAWRACRNLNDQSYLAVLHLLSQSSAGSLAPYDNTALDDDAEECGTNLTGTARDSTGAAQATAALGGVGPGQANEQPPIDLPFGGRLVITGLLQMIQCPGDVHSGTSPFDNTETLHVNGGVPPNLTLLSTRTVGLGGPREYLHNDSIVVTDAQLRSAAGLSNNSSGTASVRLERVGLTCGLGYILLPNPAVLGEFVVTLAANQCASPRIASKGSLRRPALQPRIAATISAPSSTGCPLQASAIGPTATTVGDQFSGSVAATGGTGTYTYQLGGEPPDDVVLNSLTGTFSGQIVEDGTFTFSVRVTSGSDHVDVPFRLVVAKFPIPPEPPPSGTCPDIIAASTSSRTTVAVSSDSLKHLTCIDNLEVVAGPVSFDQLTKVEEDIAVEFQGANAQFPVLQTSGFFSISGADNQTSINLSTLQTVWGLDIDDNISLTQLTLGPMTVNGNLDITGNPLLTTLANVSCGITVLGSLSISDNANISTAEAVAKAACMNVKGRRTVFGNKP